METHISPIQELREIALRINRSIELTEKNYQSLSDAIQDILGEIDNVMGVNNGLIRASDTTGN